MFKNLLKLANQLDQKGLYQEADILDLIVKQAIDMTDEEYKKYYGQPRKEEKQYLDPTEPSGYKKYYGRDIPDPAFWDWFNKGPGAPEIKQNRKPEATDMFGRARDQGYDFTKFLDWMIDIARDLKHSKVKILSVKKYGAREVFIETDKGISIFPTNIVINKQQNVVVKSENTNWIDDEDGILLITEPEAQEYIYELAKGLMPNVNT